jgi:hypothetical protein
MRPSPSKSSSALLCVAFAAALLAWPASAYAQACCAGSSALTPGRLALHEDALVGLQTRTGFGFGSFGNDGSFASFPKDTSELDLEQDLFGAVRVLDRGQVALLVPLVEARRATPTNSAETGGGIGDVNLSARYDFTLAGASTILPGIAVLAGVTLPTGRPPESAKTVLAVDATGVGALQANLGLALEQSFGPWLVNATGIVAKRFPYTANGIHEALAPQVTMLAAVAYTFPNEDALALLASYTVEGDPTVDGVATSGSARRTPLVGLSGVLPIGDTWRALGGVSVNPPIAPLGLNLPNAAVTFTVTVLRSWS